MSKNKDVASLSHSHLKQWERTHQANWSQAVVRLTLTVRILGGTVIGHLGQWSLRYQRGWGRGAHTVYRWSCARLMASGPPPQGLPHTSTLLLELQVSNHRHISIWENSQFWVYWKRKDSHNNTTQKDQFLDPSPNQNIEGTQRKFSPPFKRNDLLTWSQHSALWDDN